MSISRYRLQYAKLQRALSDAVEQRKQHPQMFIGHLIYLNDARTPLFQLEGLARIDSRISKHRTLAKDWLKRYKQLEDAIGQYDYWWVYCQSNRKWGFTGKARQYLRDQTMLNLGAMEALFMEHGWLVKMPDGFDAADIPLRRFEKTVAAVRWSDSVKEKKQLLKLFRDESLKIDHKVRTGAIDLNLVEEGIHEFRRKVRWLGIYASALNGKVVLGKGRSSALKNYDTEANRSYKFNQLPVSKEESDTISFLAEGFYAMSELIKSVGDIKDPALATEEMERIAALLRLPRNIVQSRLGSEFMGHKYAVSAAKAAIERKVLKENLFRHIAEHFDAQLT